MKTSKSKIKIRKKFISLLLVIALLAGLGAFFWFYNSRDFPKAEIQNVLLISIDTCRADHLSCYGYKEITTPIIDSIAAEGILFENVVASCPMTLPSHSSMLTGTIPVYHGVHNNIGYQLGQSNITLAEILKDAGFTTGAAVSALVLDSQFGIDQGFENFDDRFISPVEDNLLVQRRGDETTEIAIDWLKKNKDKRFFFFLHYYEPHFNYVPPEPFASKFAPDFYAGEIAFTDYCIGRVITKLKEMDLYDSTLIIVTSDHGEMLKEHGEPTHGYFIYQSAIKVPLLFKIPGWNKAVRIKQLAGLIDIVPTVCSLLDIVPPSVVQGVDLSGCFRGGAEFSAAREYYCESLQPTSYGANSLLGLITDRFKYIQTTKPELYNLVNDPAESNNLIEQQFNFARILKDKLAQIIQQSTAVDSNDSKVEMDDKTLRRLESLGYVGGGIVEDFDFNQTKDDPKDVLNFHLLNDEIAATLASRKYAAAKQMAMEMIRMRPDCASGYQNAAEADYKQGDYSSAVDYYQRALKLEPDSDKTHNNLGVVLKSLGKPGDAIKHYQQALQLKPDYVEAHNNLAIASESLGELDQAIEHYQQALKFNPDYAPAHFNLGMIYFSEKNNPEQAFMHFEQALQLNPKFSETFFKIADMLYKQEKNDHAITLHKLVLKSEPGNVVARTNLGDMFASQGNTAEAIKCYRRAIKDNPRYITAYNNFAWLLATAGDNSVRNRVEAIALAQKACEFTKYKNPVLLDTLAAAYAANSDFAEAIETAQKAIPLTVGNEKLMNEIQGRIELYKASKPYYLKRANNELENLKIKN